MIDMKFPRHSASRIFVEKFDDVIEVKKIMREIDKEEFEGYYPSRNGVELAAVFSEENFNMISTCKFDEMNVAEVLKRTWAKGIKCFAVLESPRASW